ncbi:MAG: endonuclease domain-containing protein [Xanthomonadales bacterium]|nr:endonuclease domain-containing protein [Xanthomonadales bacterium]
MRTFRFLEAEYRDGELRLGYAFDGGPDLVERLRFPDAPRPAPERAPAFAAALRLLHLIAGVSYYKAFAPARIEVAGQPPDPALAAALEEIYVEGLAEFAFRNGIELAGAVRFPASGAVPAPPPPCPLPRRALVPLGGGKDSLVALELLKAAGEPLLAVWVGRSALIAACAERAGVPALAIERELAPELFELNRQGALNGHVPVTAIHSAILTVAALLYGADAIVFANERSADLPTRVAGGRAVNHQWSKSLRFETLFRELLRRRVAGELEYFSLLRGWTELAVARRFARLPQYFEVFSSCNRNFRILGTRPASRWCGECPKCHFVFLALAPFLPKPTLCAIFGRNLLDEEALISPLCRARGRGRRAPLRVRGRDPRGAGRARRARGARGVARGRGAGRGRGLAPGVGRAAAARGHCSAAEGPDHVPARLRRVADAAG